VTISLLINEFRKLFGRRKADKSSRVSRSFDDSCPKCGNVTFSYDSYWNESCCQQCGWTIQGNRVRPVQNKQLGIENKTAASPAKTSGDLTFSYTKISLFASCPRAYEYKYVQREEELFSTIEQHLGKSIHSALKSAYTERNAGTSISVDSLIRAYRKAWQSLDSGNVKIVKKGVAPSEYYSKGQDMLKSFYHRVLEVDKGETVALEKYFEIKLNSAIRYRGVIDRISREPNGKVRITDFKTGSRINEPTEDFQLSSYALWAFEEFEEKDLEVVFEALADGKSMRGRLKQSEMPTIRKNLLAAINNVVSTKTFYAKPSPLCEWCGYSPICSDSGRYYVGRKETRAVSRDPRKCPRCGGDLEERSGRYGSFIGCAEFPDCRYTREDW